MDLTREQRRAIEDYEAGRIIEIGDVKIPLIDLCELARMALRASAEGEPVADPERVAQLIAHRACCGVEHDPANGKLHGYCVVCGVPWPCEYAGKPPARPAPSGMVDASYKSLYEELLYAVGKKWPNETRHQTALRYIQNAEAHQDNRACAAAPVAGEGKEGE